MKWLNIKQLYYFLYKNCIATFVPVQLTNPMIQKAEVFALKVFHSWQTEIFQENGTNDRKTTNCCHYWSVDAYHVIYQKPC